jgi:hypothetical protein
MSVGLQPSIKEAINSLMVIWEIWTERNNIIFRQVHWLSVVSLRRRLEGDPHHHRSSRRALHLRPPPLPSGAAAAANTAAVLLTPSPSLLFLSLLLSSQISRPRSGMLVGVSGRPGLWIRAT